MTAFFGADEIWSRHDDDAREPVVLAGVMETSGADAGLTEADFLHSLDELKEHYCRGGLGDGTCKKLLFNILNDRLKPIRERRMELQKDIPAVYEILRKGCEDARNTAAETMDQVRKAMKINYFDDAELIAEQAKRFASQK